MNVCCRFLAACRVDFNLTLFSSETCIADLHQLIDFALSCRLPELQFLFLSSIAAVSRLESLLPILEHAAPAAVVVGSGYGESKWVVEVLLTTHRSHHQDSFARCDCEERQVSGGLDGYCNSSDWLSSMIQSASSVKRLPLTSTKMVSTCRPRGTVPRNVSHVATHSHHPADGIVYTLGCFRQGDRRRHRALVCYYHHPQLSHARTPRRKAGRRWKVPRGKSEGTWTQSRRHSKSVNARAVKLFGTWQGGTVPGESLSEGPSATLAW